MFIFWCLIMADNHTLNYRQPPPHYHWQGQRWRRQEHPIIRAISRGSEGSSSGTLSVAKTPVGSLPSTPPAPIPCFLPQKLAYSLQWGFLFHYSTHVNKINSPWIQAKVSAKSQEVPDMNYWQSNGTQGTVLELKPESNHGEESFNTSMSVCTVRDV